jgi:hypothetical protein
MNALRHGLSSAMTDATTFEVQQPISNPHSVDAVVGKLHRIDLERVKILAKIEDFAKLPQSDELFTSFRWLAALQRYSQRSYSELRKHVKSSK